MPYQVPRQWTHGDVPTAAEMNKYSNSLNEIRVKTKDRAINFLTRQAQAHPQGSTLMVANEFWFVHKRRLLWFLGSGKIVSSNGANTTSISSASANVWNSYDLDSVNWLAYGMTYQVTGVTSCSEW